MNEAVIVFTEQAVTAEEDGSVPYPVTKLMRVDFEGTSEGFLRALNVNFVNEPKFRVVAMESLSGNREL